MLSLPVCVLINLVVVEYYRFKVLYTFELLVAFVAQAVLLLMYDPNSKVRSVDQLPRLLSLLTLSLY